MIWVGVFVFFFILELITVSLVSIWFCAGAAVAGLLYLAECPFWVQTVVFFAVSLPCLLLFYPLAKNFRKSKTNIDTILGLEGIVTRDIDPIGYEGRVKVRGQDWAACTQSSETIEKGSLVIVEEIQGVRLVVSRKTKGD